LSAAELAANGGEYVTAAKQVGAAEQVVAAVSTLPPAELAAKGGEYVTAVLSAGAAEQVGGRSGQYVAAGGTGGEGRPICDGTATQAGAAEQVVAAVSTLPPRGCCRWNWRRREANM
jgi:hypothetical protein